MHHAPLLLPPLFLPLFLAGCMPDAPASFDSPEPAARNRAIVHAAAARDEDKIPDLIRMLDSDDPLTRMLAIRTLQDLTGETRGYDYRDPHERRRRAIAAWLDDDAGRQPGNRGDQPPKNIQGTPPPVPHP